MGVGEGRALLVQRLDRLLQLVLADRLLAHLRHPEDVVDNLLLEQRRPDLLEGLALNAEDTALLDELLEARRESK